MDWEFQSPFPMFTKIHSESKLQEGASYFISGNADIRNSDKSFNKISKVRST